jgi:hypothetical protein
MVDREIEQGTDGETAPAMASGAWAGERVPIAVSDSE